MGLWETALSETEPQLFPALPFRRRLCLCVCMCVRV